MVSGWTLDHILSSIFFYSGALQRWSRAQYEQNHFRSHNFHCAPSNTGNKHSLSLHRFYLSLCAGGRYLPDVILNKHHILIFSMVQVFFNQSAQSLGNFKAPPCVKFENVQLSHPPVVACLPTICSMKAKYASQQKTQQTYYL